MRLQFKKIFVYMDGPQVFLLEDHISKDLFLCAAIVKAGYKYPAFCCHVEDFVLDAYLKDEIDLLNVFQTPFSDDSYIFVELSSKDNEIPYRFASFDEIINEDNYPYSGFYARNHTED